MDNAALSLLTLGLPNTQADKKTLADSNAGIVSSSAPQDATEVTVQFQDVLALTGISFQTLQKQPDASIIELVQTNDKLEADFFKKLGSETGRDVIAAILPPASIILDQVPWQKSFVASVAYVPSVQPVSQQNDESSLASLDISVVTPTPETPIADHKTAFDEVLNQTASSQISSDTLSTTQLPPPELQETLSLYNLPADDTDGSNSAHAYTTVSAANVTDAVTDLTASPAFAKMLPSTTQSEAITIIPPAPFRTIIHTYQAPALSTEQTSNNEILSSTLTSKETSRIGETAKPLTLKTSDIFSDNSTSYEDEKLSSFLSAANPLSEESNVFEQKAGIATLKMIIPEATYNDTTTSPIASVPTQTHLHTLENRSETSPLKFSINQYLNTTATASEQISVHILQARSTKTDKITITLHPAELGKVEIRMHIDANHTTIINVQTESQDTYNLLRADRSNLEQILQDSGLKMDSNNLQFGYRGSGNEANHSGERGFSGNSPDQASQTESKTLSEREIIEQPLTSTHIALSVTTGVNIRV